MREQARLAIKGLVGWTEYGGGEGYTWHGSRDEDELTAPIRIDKSGPLARSNNPVRDIWTQPNLDLNLPDGNVRNLCEGCVGFQGTTRGHPWDGDLESLRSTDSVGLDVYVSMLISYGAVRL